MNRQSSPFTSHQMAFSWTFWLVGLALISGFFLSILSWLELCVEHCAANQDYRLFGFPFAVVGMTFFTAMLFIHGLSGYYAVLRTWTACLIGSALGAELMFMVVQKYQIGHWCPVCLSIAASVAFTALVLFAGYLKTTIQSHNRGAVVQTIKQGFTSLSFIVFGFLMAFIGISNPNSAEATAKEIKDKLAFGLRGSPIEIYFVTDWFCPSCKKVEPIMEKLYPKIRSEATFYFIDYPIHKNSMNFSPYNVAFLINNKDHYFKARKLLRDLSEKNESPKDNDVEAAALKAGVAFREISYLDAKSGMDYFDSIVDKYKLKYTPTLIISNSSNHKVITLEGRDEMTEAKILDALEKVGKK